MLLRATVMCSVNQCIHSDKKTQSPLIFRYKEILRPRIFRLLLYCLLPLLVVVVCTFSSLFLRLRSLFVRCTHMHSTCTCTHIYNI